MDISLLFKIAAVGILVSILSQVLKHSGREEQAFLTSLAGLLLVLFWIVPYIYDLFESTAAVFTVKVTERKGKAYGYVQIGILGVAGVLLAVQFKSGKSEYGIYLSVALSLFIFLAVIGQLSVMVDALSVIGEYIRMDTAYISTLIKMIGITYVAEFSSGICKDAGYQTIAVQIEIFGKLMILVLSMPILTALLDTIREFLS